MEIGEVIKPLLDKLFELIKEQTKYATNYESYIDVLNSEVEALTTAKVELKEKVRAVKIGTTNDILPTVDHWFGKAEEHLKNAKEIQDKVSEVGNGCFSMRSRCSLSRKAEKSSEQIRIFLEKEKLRDISTPAPPISKTLNPPKPIPMFKSRKVVEDGVVRALESGSVHLIGICGMSGVGKTTLVAKVRYEKRALFDDNVMVVVGDKKVETVQLELSQYLGLSINENKSSQAMAIDLRRRIGENRSLIILDDVQRVIDFEALIGLGTSDLKNCKILVTSENKEVLSRMEANIFAVDPLSEDEAWSLFRDTAGSCVDKSNLKSIAKEIAKECEGLPLGIVSLGEALKDKEKHHWKNALKGLISSDPKFSDSEHLQEVYGPLKLCFELLHDEDAESLLLLCSQFPKDFNISVDELTLYATGLRLWPEGVSNLSEARDEVAVKIDKLKSRCLLCDGDHGDSVKIHDLVRSVVRSIAREKKLVGDARRSEWILEFTDTKIEFLDERRGCNFPNLNILIVQKHSEMLDFLMEHRGVKFLIPLDERMAMRRAKSLEISDLSFLERSEELRVLSLKEVSFDSLPRGMALLKKLRTLRLYNCALKDISIIGKLPSLEILSCIWCVNISEIPLDIRKLEHLKLLDFSNCKGLKTVAPGVLSNLVALEELRMLQSFDGWESSKRNETERKNATLMELQSLHNLARLEIRVKDLRLLEEEIELPRSVENYKIICGNVDAPNWFDTLTKGLALSRLPEDIRISSWIERLATSAEGLYIDGEGSKNFDLSQVQGTIKSLEVRNCRGIEALVNTEQSRVFGELEFLLLGNLPNIKELCASRISDEALSFDNLKMIFLENLPSLSRLTPNQKVVFPRLSEVAIWECNELRNPLSMEIGMDAVLELEHLDIRRCGNMKELFFHEGRSNLKFEKLKKLTIESMPSLRSFGQGLESLDFPVLEDLTIDFLDTSPPIIPVLKLDDFYRLEANTENREVERARDYRSLNHFFDVKVEFGRLERLELRCWDNIRSLFSSSISKSVAELETISVSFCSGMEQLIEVEKKTDEIDKCEAIEEDDEEIARKSIVTFPKLQVIRLDVSNLTSLGKGIQRIEFPVLHTLDIRLEFSHKRKQKSPDNDDDVLGNNEVIFGRLKTLEIDGHDKLIQKWCKQIQPCFFTTLEELQIVGCHNITSLFPSSMVENLKNLTTLTIISCNKMEQVVQEDQGETSKLFPSLKVLALLSLPSLEIFCQWRCALFFPLLESITIDKCPRMETLARGSLRTPMLATLTVDDTRFLRNELSGIDDLNNFLRQHIVSTKQKASTSLATT
ncbi:probable disease resistance protein At4g27220 isoform X2 [Andrographis paniculata]|uniref:probable disease resistance protein At4g27220 isoform X2 n=1 Tax=Andrographis paniculata TaxID=175694 RepID=UPI0021E84ECE|nr:probable disease resistance protein At4g27220 isoform X2 [Andrographis paniculata]